MEKAQDRLIVPKWLKRIQENSWEPEILLSGLVLIGLLQLPDKIRQLSIFFDAEVLSGNLSALFVALEQVCYILIFGVIAHLFLRSVWVGMIGLSYTFPGGIRVNKFGFTEKFENQVRKLPAIEEQIILLEKICSSIFASCFFLIMVIIGALLSLIWFVAFVFLVAYIFTLFGIEITQYLDTNIDPVITVVLVIMLIDFVGIGLFRKHKKIAKIFYPIHRLIGWLTLSRIYRSIYYIFASNLNKWSLRGFFLLFVVVIFLGQVQLKNAKDNKGFSLIEFYGRDLNNNLFSGYFADRNQDWKSVVLELPSPIISGRFLEVRLRHMVMYENAMVQLCGITEEELKRKSQVDEEKKLACFNQFYQLNIDGEWIENADWMYYFHQDQGRKGGISFIDISELAPGKHSLELYLNFGDHGKQLRTKLYFFKE